MLVYQRVYICICTYIIIYHIMYMFLSVVVTIGCWGGGDERCRFVFTRNPGNMVWNWFWMRCRWWSIGKHKFTHLYNIHTNLCVYVFTCIKTMFEKTHVTWTLSWIFMMVSGDWTDTMNRLQRPGDTPYGHIWQGRFFHRYVQSNVDTASNTWGIRPLMSDVLSP